MSSLAPLRPKFRDREVRPPAPADENPCGPCRQLGFTLLELMVVVAILALAAAIVLPRFSTPDSSRLRNSARATAAMLRYLGERGATTGTTYRLHLSVADNAINVLRVDTKGEESRDSDPFFSRNVLAEGVSLEDVELQSLGRVAEGEVAVHVGPRGLAEFVILHLKGKSDEHYTVFAYPNGGRVKVASGYQETDR